MEKCSMFVLLSRVAFFVMQHIGHVSQIAKGKGMYKCCSWNCIYKTKIINQSVCGFFIFSSFFLEGKERSGRNLTKNL